MKSKTDRYSIKKLTFEYVLAIVLLAAMSITTHLIAAHIFKSQESVALVVNISGRQRMLSQRTSMLLTRLIYTHDKEKQMEISRELIDAIAMMEKSYKALMNGDLSIGIPKPSSQIKALYLNPPLSLDKKMRGYLDMLKARTYTTDSELARIQLIPLNMSSEILNGLDVVVMQYQKESEAAIKRLMYIEGFLLTANLLCLMMVALLIFRPMSLRIKRGMEELEESNKDLEQFAYVASHDLQEPLRKIASFTELLAKKYRGQLDSKADIYIDYIIDGAKRMRTLINDLLTYSRVTTHGKKFVEVDCNKVLSRVLHDMELSIKESGAVVTSDTLPAVMDDDLQIGQVFQNLISNAIRYRKNEPPNSYISSERRGNEWLILVRDNGIGIEPEYHERIFQLFQRLHTRAEYPAGTGIGLAVCKRVIERHGGRIWVASELGKGATFYFTIPMKGG